MTQTSASSVPRFPVDNWEIARDAWIAELKQLSSDVERWASARGWDIRRETKQIVEDEIGGYEVPVVTVQMPTGRVHLNPVARFVIGASGMIEMYGVPSFAQVVLLRRDGMWRMFTDDLVDLNKMWSEETFGEIVSSLPSAP